MAEYVLTYWRFSDMYLRRIRQSVLTENVLLYYSITMLFYITNLQICYYSLIKPIQHIDYQVLSHNALINFV